MRHTGEIEHALVFAGARGWKYRETFEAVDRFGLQNDVLFLGYVPLQVLVALYNLAEVLVFPSLYEGFGLPLVEAMSCGTPIVTSRGGALEEIAGQAAQFVDPTDVDSIAEGVRSVLNDRDWQAALREQGLARVARFSWTTTALQTRQMYLHYSS